MLKIRGFKASDREKIADIIKKVPFNLRQKSQIKEGGLRWSINISDPVRKPTARINRRANLLRQEQMKKDLVIVDNNEIIGVVQKSRGDFANLYLNKKYYRKGIGAELINTVEGSFLKKIGNRKIIRAPIAPISITKHNYNIPVGNNAAMNKASFKPTPLIKKHF